MTLALRPRKGHIALFLALMPWVFDLMIAIPSAQYYRAAGDIAFFLATPIVVVAILLGCAILYAQRRLHAAVVAMCIGMSLLAFLDHFLKIAGL